MITEKETIEKILRTRGIIANDGSFDAVRFNKLVTEPWIHQKAKQYGFLDGTSANEIVDVPVAPATVEINETPAEQEVNLTELPVEEAKIEELAAEEPIVEEPAVEEPTAEEPVVEEEKPAKKSTKKASSKK